MSEKPEAKPVTAPKLMSVPAFGKAYFGMSAPTSYAAARRGDFPTIRIGKLMWVPVAAAEAKLFAGKLNEAR
jgi:hypothetical protein